MNTLATKKYIYILIAVVTLTLAIFIVLLNYYYVYRNVNRIRRAAENTSPNVDLFSRAACNIIRDSFIVKFLVPPDAISRAQARCLTVPQ